MAAVAWAKKGEWPNKHSCGRTSKRTSDAAAAVTEARAVHAWPRTKNEGSSEGLLR